MPGPCAGRARRSRGWCAPARNRHGHAVFTRRRPSACRALLTEQGLQAAEDWCCAASVGRRRALPRLRQRPAGRRRPAAPARRHAGGDPRPDRAQGCWTLAATATFWTVRPARRRAGGDARRACAHWRTAEEARRAVATRQGAAPRKILRHAQRARDARAATRRGGGAGGEPRRAAQPRAARRGLTEALAALSGARAAPARLDGRRGALERVAAGAGEGCRAGHRRHRARHHRAHRGHALVEPPAQASSRPAAGKVEERLFPLRDRRASTACTADELAGAACEISGAARRRSTRGGDGWRWREVEAGAREDIAAAARSQPRAQARASWRRRSRRAAAAEAGAGAVPSG